MSGTRKAGTIPKSIQDYLKRKKPNVILKEIHLYLFMLKDCPTSVRNFGTNGGRFIEILVYKEKMEMAKSGIR